MTEIEKFVEKMKQKYGRNVVVKMRNCNEETLTQVPQPLVELYTYYDSIEFPFGRIDSMENAVKYSNTAEPFKSKGWFCFGFDGYFSFYFSISVKYFSNVLLIIVSYYKNIYQYNLRIYTTLYIPLDQFNYLKKDLNKIIFAIFDRSINADFRAIMESWKKNG